MKPLTKIIRLAYIEDKIRQDEVHNLPLSYRTRTSLHSTSKLASTDIILKRKIGGNLPIYHHHVDQNIETILEGKDNKNRMKYNQGQTHSAENLKYCDQIL